MPDLKKISPLDRQIDILHQHIKRCELDLQELYSLRPVEKKNTKPKYATHTNSEGKEFTFRVRWLRLPLGEQPPSSWAGKKR